MLFSMAAGLFEPLRIWDIPKRLRLQNRILTQAAASIIRVQKNNGEVGTAFIYRYKDAGDRAFTAFHCVNELEGLRFTTIDGRRLNIVVEAMHAALDRFNAAHHNGGAPLTLEAAAAKLQLSRKELLAAIYRGDVSAVLRPGSKSQKNVWQWVVLPEFQARAEDWLLSQRS